MKILLTGANGFLGTNLTNLLSKKHEVIAVSRSFSNLISCDVKLIEFTFENYDKLNEVFKTYKPDVVIHCAWAGGNSSKDINQPWQVYNISYGVKLLELCEKHKVNHFIGFGSSAEFGEHDLKMNEQTFCKPTSMYGISKFSFSLISEKYCNDHGIKFTWIRPVYTYGPYDVETRLIPSVIKSFLKNQELTLNSCVSIVDYLYVEDFCLGVSSIIENFLEGTFVISSGEEYVVKSIVNKIYNLIKPTSQIHYNLETNESPKFICGDAQKLKSMSDWLPKVSIDEGLINTINYFKQRV